MRYKYKQLINKIFLNLGNFEKNFLSEFNLMYSMS